MHTLLCRFRRFNHTQPQQSLPLKNNPNRGQIIVIFAVTLLALIFFTGLAIDSGSLYVTYAQLRRSVDAAAVAAANDFKAEMCVQPCTVYPPVARMKKAAIEVMKLHNLMEDSINLQLEVCNKFAESGSGKDGREDALATRQPDFFNQCPDMSIPGTSARKLVLVEATQEAPLYFLSLLGFQIVPLKAHSISEAAPIDLVLVIDTSESMASETAGYNKDDYNPADCNFVPSPGTLPANYPCQPLGKAQDAASDLINTLYPGYDRVAVVGYDVIAKDPADIVMEIDLEAAKTDVEALQVRDDPPNLVRAEWFYPVTDAGNGQQYWKLGYNPVYPEDMDGNGSDGADFAATTIDTNPPCAMAAPNDPGGRWGIYTNWGFFPKAGTPCDDPARFDAFDAFSLTSTYNDGMYTAGNEDDTAAKAWLVSHGCSNATDPPTCTDIHGNPIPYWVYLTANSTCTGCGIRVGADVLKRSGRPNAVWVMVVLSDGGVNLSDSHYTDPTRISSTFPLGYCNGGIGSLMWKEGCVDINKDMLTIPVYEPDGVTLKEYYYGFGNTRHCLKDAAHCPPGSIPLNNPGTRDAAQAYTVYDYTLDMVDYAALNKSNVLGEIPTSGSDIAIYAVGLGDADKSPAPYEVWTTGTNPNGTRPIGAYLLRYLAAVGDDGDRTTDECVNKVSGVPSPKPPTEWCGQYYYTDTGSGLSAIFNDISKRIYTRLTQ